MTPETPTHDTVIIGWKDGKVVWLKSYDYPNQTAEAQRDLKQVIDAGYTWLISSIENLRINPDQ